MRRNWCRTLGSRRASIAAISWARGRANSSRAACSSMSHRAPLRIASPPRGARSSAARRCSTRRPSAPVRCSRPWTFSSERRAAGISPRSSPAPASRPSTFRTRRSRFTCCASPVCRSNAPSSCTSIPTACIRTSTTCSCAPTSPPRPRACCRRSSGRFLVNSPCCAAPCPRCRSDGTATSRTRVRSSRAAGRNYPADHISTLYRLGQKWWDLAERGVTRIADLPADFALRGPAERQARALHEGHAIFEPSLAAALAGLRRPLAIFDFETVAPPIPIWPGCRPYEAVPVQFSVHAEDGRGTWRHHEWLAEGADDPRPEMIRRLTEACRGRADAAGVERAVRARVPGARRGRAAGARTRGLGTDRATRGRAAAGARPRLSPGLSRQLQPQAGAAGAGARTALRRARDRGWRGGAAALEELLFFGRPSEPAARERTRTALKRYCELDTWGVARLLQVLEQRAREG